MSIRNNTEHSVLQFMMYHPLPSAGSGCTVGVEFYSIRVYIIIIIKLIMNVSLRFKYKILL